MMSTRQLICSRGLKGLLPVLGSCLLTLVLSPVSGAVELESDWFESNIALDSTSLKEVRHQYGFFASRRVSKWQNLVSSFNHISTPEERQASLKQVNQFFNRIPYKEDQTHWQAEDYWASPVEFIGTYAGDCEDYSIAKYFTLRAMGIPDKDLRITYVRQSEDKTEHMVLLYLGENSADPMVLDNVDTTIKPLSERQDLEVMYSFNSESLWQISLFGGQEVIGRSSKITQWSDLLLRLKS